MRLVTALVLLASCYRAESTSCHAFGVAWLCASGEKCAALELGGCLIETCGNGKVDPGEECDGAAPVGKSCLDYGYNGGHIKGCASSCTPDLSACGIGWAPAPTSRILTHDGEGSFYSLWGSAPDHVLAGSSLEGPVGFDGSVWSIDLTTLAETPTCLGLWGSADNDVYCAGEFAYHFDGAAWSQDPDAPDESTAVWGSAANDVFMVGQFGVLGHYDGTTWTVTSPEPSAAPLNSVWGDGPRNVFAVGDRGIIQRWDGFAWQPQSSGTSVDLHGVWGAGGLFFAVGEGGTILRFVGGSWAPMTSPTQSTLHAVWGSSRTEIYAVGESGVLLRFDGSSWTQMSSGTQGSLLAVWGSGSGDVFAAGVNGTLIHLGGTWFAPGNNAGVDDLNAVWGDSDEDVFAVGANGAIRHFDGSAWTKIDAQTLGNFTAVWGSGPDDVWAGGTELYHFDGSAWTLAALQLSFGDNVNGFWGSGPDDVYVAATSSYTQGALYHFDGTSFSSPMYDLPQPLHAVWGSGPDDVWAGGGISDVKFNLTSSLFHFDGNSWSPVKPFAPVILFGLWGSSPSDVFALGVGFEESGVWHFDGSRWSQSSSTQSLHLGGGGSGDLFALGTDRIDHFDGSGWGGIQPPVYALWAGVSVQPLSVFFVGSGGTVLRMMRDYPSLP
jgi:hypothetical protein